MLCGLDNSVFEWFSVRYVGEKSESEAVQSL